MDYLENRRDTSWTWSLLGFSPAELMLPGGPVATFKLSETPTHIGQYNFWLNILPPAVLFVNYFVNTKTL